MDEIIVRKENEPSATGKFFKSSISAVPVGPSSNKSDRHVTDNHRHRLKSTISGEFRIPFKPQDRNEIR